MISIVDVGCRYGVFPIFSDSFELFDYVGVDVDEDEIIRLRQKYNQKHIRFFPKFLSSDNKQVSFNISQHRGYGSSKKMNPKSIWFGSIRTDETQIVKHQDYFSEKSSIFMSQHISNHSIIKLDIEGGELDFLNGLDENSFETIEAFIIEAHFDSPYLTDSNFYTIGNFLSKKNYWAVSLESEDVRLNKFYEAKDSIPCCSTIIFIKDIYNPQNYSSNTLNSEVMCEILYALKLDGLLLNFLLENKPKQFQMHRLFDKIKYTIGHKLNRLVKEPYIEKSEIESLYFDLFNDKFPLLSDFYESTFYNPLR